MRWAQEQLADTDARVVSVSVDPEFDTPEVLREYAQRYAAADPERWLFLTGDEEQTYGWIRASFKLPVAKNPDADPGLLVTHSSKLVAVDAAGRVRGWYDANERAGTEAAVARVRFLARAAAGGSPSSLPLVDAVLNGVAALLLGCGWLAIRSGRRQLHGRLMRLAFVTSAAFLACYLYYHFVVVPAQGGPTRFGGTGAPRAIYLVLLATHVVGAIVNLPLVLRVLWLAGRGRWDEHRRLARRTLPLWLYVSVTGVLVYLLLYPFNPARG